MDASYLAKLTVSLPVKLAALASNELRIPILQITSNASRVFLIATPASLADHYMSAAVVFYLQGGIFLDFQSHGQLRCCLLHRHLGFVGFSCGCLCFFSLSISSD